MKHFSALKKIMAPPRSRFGKWGHPVDMKTAPPWSRNGSTFFFQRGSFVII